MVASYSMKTVKLNSVSFLTGAFLLLYVGAHVHVGLIPSKATKLSVFSKYVYTCTFAMFVSHCIHGLESGFFPGPSLLTIVVRNLLKYNYGCTNAVFSHECLYTY